MKLLIQLASKYCSILCTVGNVGVVTEIEKLQIKSGERIRASAGGCIFCFRNCSLKIQAYALKALSYVSAFT